MIAIVIFLNPLKVLIYIYLDAPYSNLPQLCVTREQTKGKGQYGREWIAQKDGSIIFSIRKSFHEDTISMDLVWLLDWQ